MKEEKLGRGISIQGFESLEELLAHQEEMERQAIEDALPEQWAIDYGDLVFRVADDLPIFGRIFTELTFLADNTSEGQSAPDPEIVAEWEGIESAHQKGYRYGKWYSSVCPEGELGSAHVVTLWRISNEDFTRARLMRWELWTELAQQIYEESHEARERNDHE